MNKELAQHLAALKKQLKHVPKKHLITELFYASLAVKQLEAELAKLKGAPAEQTAEQAPQTFGNEKE